MMVRQKANPKWNIVLLRFFNPVGIRPSLQYKPYRAGDIATSYRNPAIVKAKLGWGAKYGIEDMVRNSWDWQRQDLEGYLENN